jgi:hypothetical protein
MKYWLGENAGPPSKPPWFSRKTSHRAWPLTSVGQTQTCTLKHWHRLYGLEQTLAAEVGIAASGADVGVAQELLNLTVKATASALPASTVKRIMELYIVFFNCMPDADGLEHWIGQARLGLSINRIAETFSQLAPTMQR